MAPKRSNSVGKEKLPITVVCLSTFTTILGSLEFKHKFPLRAGASVPTMLRWVHDECVGPAADQLRSTLGKKAEARAKAIEKPHASGGAEPAVITTSFKDGNPVLQEMGTEQMNQFLRMVISFMMYAEKDQ